MSSHDIHSRRRMLGVVLRLAPLAALGVLTSSAAAARRLDARSTTARALGYSPDGSRTTRPAPDQRCAMCQHFAGGEAEWGPCAVFLGAEVNAGGWCKAFSAR